MYEKFEALLQERNLTPYKVSLVTGIAQSTLSDWKNNRSKPKFNKLLILARYFGVSVEYFADDKEADEKEEM